MNRRHFLKRLAGALATGTAGVFAGLRLALLHGPPEPPAMPEDLIFNPTGYLGYMADPERIYYTDEGKLFFFDLANHRHHLVMDYGAGDHRGQLEQGTRPRS